MEGLRLIRRTLCDHSWIRTGRSDNETDSNRTKVQARMFVLGLITCVKCPTPSLLCGKRAAKGLGQSPCESSAETAVTTLIGSHGASVGKERPQKCRALIHWQTK